MIAAELLTTIVILACDAQDTLEETLRSMRGRACASPPASTGSFGVAVVGGREDGAD